MMGLFSNASSTLRVLDYITGGMNTNKGEFIPVFQSNMKMRYDTFLGGAKWADHYLMVFNPGVIVVFEDKQKAIQFLNIKFFFYDRGNMTEEQFYLSKMKEAYRCIARTFVLFASTNTRPHGHKVATQIQHSTKPQNLHTRYVLVMRDVSKTQDGDLLVALPDRTHLDDMTKKVRYYIHPNGGGNNPSSASDRKSKPAPKQRAASEAKTTVRQRNSTPPRERAQPQITRPPVAVAVPQPAQAVLSSSEDEAEPGMDAGGLTWKCRMCTLVNKPLALTCAACTTEKAMSPVKRNPSNPRSQKKPVQTARPVTAKPVPKQAQPKPTVRSKAKPKPKQQQQDRRQSKEQQQQPRKPHKPPMDLVVFPEHVLSPGKSEHSEHVPASTLTKAHNMLQKRKKILFVNAGLTADGKVPVPEGQEDAEPKPVKPRRTRREYVPRHSYELLQMRQKKLTSVF
jgi:hypothetical protein